MKPSQSSSGDNNASLEESLYQKRKKLYPREVHGLFARLRLLGVLSLLGLYYFLPWLQWGDHQAVLFDLPNRKFYLFDWLFWPQDFFFLALLLIIAGLSLFFFTALAGRLWCGYACPQTVWTEAFLWIERRIEGDRNKQIKRDKAPWGVNKLLVKGSKHGVWIAFSLFTGLTFVGFFTPIQELSTRLLNNTAGAWEIFWVLFYGFATYLNAGWMREQVCIYMCPYARFQSAMFDQDTLIISYDDIRGEPRGNRKQGVEPSSIGLGDCIDCSLCVQVCPTGIDIRDGLQYQCIGCAACIDVCDDVMEKMNYPKGLVRYTTQNAMQGKGKHVLRGRVLVYAALLLAMVAGLFYSISQRMPLELDIIRDRNSLYRETNEGFVENVYTLKLINMDKSAHQYHIWITGLEGGELLIKQHTHYLFSGEVLEITARVKVDPIYLEKTSSEVMFHVQAIDEPEMFLIESGRFVGPLVR